MNQIEINPFLHRKDAIAQFKSKGVLMQAYRSLRAGKEHDNETVARIAAKHGKSPAQIMGAWAVQHGYVYIPKSSKKHRMVENASVVDITLDAEDLAALDLLTTCVRCFLFFVFCSLMICGWRSQQAAGACCA